MEMPDARVSVPRALVIAVLALSGTALAFAPTLMPADYSWLSHTTSESAAQGLSGAWLTRLGFLTFGLAVLWLASLAAWPKWGARLHAGFGVLMVAAAAFSHKPFRDGIAFDHTEDLLHSVAATAMGFAFAAGVAVVAVTAGNRGRPRRLLDVAALAASVAIPLAMVVLDGYAGLLQRKMFLVAYLWYGLEALLGSGDRNIEQRPDQEGDAGGSCPQ